MADAKLEASIGVAVLVLNKERDKVLLGIRQGGFMPDWYGLPGGKTDLSETLEECAKRELAEEAGITADSLEYIGVVRDSRETYDFIHFGYLAKTYTGEIRTMEPNKCKGWEWIPLDSLPEKILRGHAGLIQLYLDKKKGVMDFHK